MIEMKSLFGIVGLDWKEPYQINNAEGLREWLRFIMQYDYK